MIMQPLLRDGAAALALTLLATQFQTGASLRAQQKPAHPTCATLLTADEITKIVGEPMKDMGADERGPGETECAWMLHGGSAGFKSVSVQFYDKRAVLTGSAVTTLDGLFEEAVSGAEGVASGKREMLPGIGSKAAVVPTDPQVLAIVQRADGVARIVGNNLTKAQIVAVARAVAAP